MPKNDTIASNETGAPSIQDVSTPELHIGVSSTTTEQPTPSDDMESAPRSVARDMPESDPSDPARENRPSAEESIRSSPAHPETTLSAQSLSLLEASYESSSNSSIATTVISIDESDVSFQWSLHSISSSQWTYSDSGSASGEIDEQAENDDVESTTSDGSTIIWSNDTDLDSN